MKQILLLFAALFANMAYAQNNVPCTFDISMPMAVTEENYLKADSALWDEYAKRTKALYGQIDENPDKKDSLMRILETLDENVRLANIDLAKRFAAVPSGLHRLYMVRDLCHKDTLRKILSSLPYELRTSYHGRIIRKYIDTKQVCEGDTMATFKCMTDRGDAFDWNSLDGKRVLLIYEGLSCMGGNRFDELVKLYEENSRDSFEVLVYCDCASLDELKKRKSEYPSPFPFISDFMGEESPIRIKYGTQVRPTCFLIGADRLVRMKSEGLDIPLVKKHL